MVNDFANTGLDQLLQELELLFSKKRKISKEVDEIDTLIIGIREEIRNRKEKKGL